MMFVLVCLSSCKDDKKTEIETELPPKVEDVVAQYAGDKVKVTLDGESVSTENLQIDLLQAEDKSLTIKLINVIPGVREFSIPNTEFETATKSLYISKLKGENRDFKAGYDVTFEGIVDEGVLTASIATQMIEGDSINVKNVKLTSKTFKGMMGISLSDDTEPFEMVQRVYTAAAGNRDTSSIKLQIKNFSFQGLALGDISLDNILVLNRGVENDAAVYAFKTEGQMMSLDAIGEVEINAQGTIIGETMELTLDVNALTAGLKVNVDFKGDIANESSDTKATITVNGDAVAEGVTASGNTYTFKAWSKEPNLLVLTPVIEIPATAVLDSIVIYNAANQKLMSVENRDTPINFAMPEFGYVGYHITPEDVRYPTKKMLKVELINESIVFNMQTWVNGDGNKPTPKGLSNSNLAATFFPALGIDVPVPVVKADDNSALITTSRTVSETNPSGMVPGVTAGTLFLGEFKLDIFNTLKSTKFGIPYRSKPVSFEVTYKYTPGATFYKTIQNDKNQNLTEVVPTEKDSCSISAYLYEVSKYDESLDGTNINSSDKVILKATLPNGSAQASYQTLSIPFEETGNGSYDPAKKYKLAIVCSSSKRGDEFMGADGSQLYVKYLEVK